MKIKLFLVLIATLFLTACGTQLRNATINEAVGSFSTVLDETEEHLGSIPIPAQEDIPLGDFPVCVITSSSHLFEEVTHWQTLFDILQGETSLETVISDAVDGAVEKLVFRGTPFSYLFSQLINDQLEQLIADPESFDPNFVEDVREVLVQAMDDQLLSRTQAIILCDILYNEHSISFQPYFIPIQVSVNQQGEFDLEIEGAIPTPLGIIEISSEAEIIDLFPDKRLLTLVIDEKATVYELDKEEEYVIQFDFEEEMFFTEFIQDADDNITLVFETSADSD